MKLLELNSKTWNFFNKRAFTWLKCYQKLGQKRGSDRQQLWKAEITGDTVTRLSIPIRGRGKSPEEGQRWNLAET